MFQLKNNTVQVRIKDELSRSIKDIDYYTNESANETTQFGKALDYVQTRENCCGVEGVKDYDSQKMSPDFRFQNRYGIPFPSTCCAVIKTVNGSSINLEECYKKHPRYFNGKPCFNNILDKVETSFHILDGAGFSAVTIGIIAVVMSIIFAAFNVVLHMRRNRDDDRAGPTKLGQRGDRRV